MFSLEKNGSFLKRKERKINNLTYPITNPPQKGKNILEIPDNTKKIKQDGSHRIGSGGIT